MRCEGGLLGDSPPTILPGLRLANRPIYLLCKQTSSQGHRSRRPFLHRGRCHTVRHGTNREKDGTPDATAIEAAHAIYTPFMLSFYDRLVHGLSNRFAWRCPTERLLDLYRNNLASRHLEAGVGTGFFIDRADRASVRAARRFSISIAIAWRDRRAGLRAITRCCARRICSRRSPSSSSRSTASASPTCCIALPGRMAEKLKAIDHLRPLMNERAVLFGATILGKGSSRMRPRDPAPPLQRQGRVQQSRRRSRGAQ